MKGLIISPSTGDFVGLFNRLSSQSLILAGIFTVLLPSVDPARAEETHPGLGTEAQYSEAVIAYHQSQMQTAIQILDDLLARDPEFAQASELKALALQNLGNTEQAFDEYQRLYEKLSSENHDSYAFQLGVLSFRQKKYALARRYIGEALQAHYNEPVAHLFMGILFFKEEKLEEAMDHFERISAGSSTELEMMSQYYQGLIDLKIGASARGARALTQARALALSLPQNEIARSTLKTINQILAPLSASHFFGSLSFQLAYDSNISETPAQVSSQALSSNNATSQAILSGGLGYMTPALSLVQVVPSYQFNYNYNFNAATKTYEYFSNVGSLSLNINPLGKNTFGAKLGANSIFENLPTDSTLPDSPTQLTRYCFIGELGPYAYFQLTPSLRLQSELTFRSQTFFTEDALTGNDMTAQLTLSQENHSPAFNPGATLGLETNQAHSSDWRYRSLNASLFNQFRLSAKGHILLGLDYIHYSYFDSATGRSDQTLNPHLNWVQPLFERWSLTLQLSYSKNTSTLSDNYSYTRSTAGLGILRTF